MVLTMTCTGSTGYGSVFGGRRRYVGRKFVDVGWICKGSVVGLEY